MKGSTKIASFGFVRDIILRAFERAQLTTVGAGRMLNPLRSQNWLSALNDEFRRHYQMLGYSDVRTLCKACEENQDEFGLNELLTDVCVVRVGTVASYTRKKLLTRISSVIWQVESEFASSGTEVAIDFNKLILCSGENKLFVGPLSLRTLESIDKVHATFAQACMGEVFLTLVPPPNEWPSPKLPKVFVFDRDSISWIEIQ